jgi:hypothetical protein
MTLYQKNWNCKGVMTRGGLTTLLWKDRWKVYMLTNMDPPPSKGNFVTTAITPWNLTPWNGTSHHGMVQSAHGVRQQSWLYGQQLFNEPTYLQVDHKIVFPPSRSNSTQQLDSVTFSLGSIYPPRFQTPTGEEFDCRSWKKPRSSHPQIGWKIKFHHKKCYVTRELP